MLQFSWRLPVIYAVQSDFLAHISDRDPVERVERVQVSDLDEERVQAVILAVRSDQRSEDDGVRGRLAQIARPAFGRFEIGSVQNVLLIDTHKQKYHKYNWENDFLFKQNINQLIFTSWFSTLNVAVVRIALVLVPWLISVRQKQAPI